MRFEGKQKYRRNLDLCNLPITVQCTHDVQTVLHIKYIPQLTNQELWHPLSQFQLALPLQYLFLESH